MNKYYNSYCYSGNIIFHGLIPFSSITSPIVICLAGHLTSRSDVYSFGVVLLEMITGRRSMDKSRPNGEQHLVEWARPNLGERRRFYRIIDPRLEGHFSIKGAQKVAQLVHKCLCRDPKARPLMSEVVEALKPLIDLKDMACSSQYFQIMLEEENSSSRRARSGLKKQVSFTKNGHHPVRTFSYSSRASPFIQPLAKPGSVLA